MPDLVIRPPSRAASSLGGNSLPAVIQPRSPYSVNRILAAAGLVAVVVLAGAIVAFRNDIVALLPGEWRQMLQSDASGIAVQAAATPATTAPQPAPPPAPAPAPSPAPSPVTAKLEIDYANSKIELVDGRYVVRGEIVNTGRAVGSTRSLKLVFKKQDAVLGERAFALVRGPIAPGARLPFSQTFDDPPAGTTDVVPAIE